MSQANRPHFYRIGYALIIAGLMGLITAKTALRFWQEPVLNDARISQSESSAEHAPSAILVDSILSIIQSYYVDSSRVDNLAMLEATVNGLAFAPGITITETDKELDIHYGKETLHVIIPSKLTYTQLVMQLSKIGDFINNNPTANSNDSKASPLPPTGEEIVLNALLQALDAHSSLLSRESYDELRQGTEGSFGGLGVVVGVKSNFLTILRPLPRSPALRAGLRKFDRIIAIDETETYGFTLDQLVDRMRGMPGSSVNLGILREGDSYPRNVKLTRETIQVDSVKTEIIKDQEHRYLWSRIESFSSHTSEELLSALSTAQFSGANAMTGFILDLRSNPGGLLDQAIEVANLFIPTGVIVSTKGRRSEIETAFSGKKFTDFPMVVLVNSDSASASEIVAGALQDHERAAIIGQPSFGKGSVQTVFELPGQQALKLTIARYYTPLGKSIQNKGIIPDVWLQPMVSRAENKNLLGPARYRNEGFLPNHLEAKPADLSLSARSPVKNLKGYYLINHDNDEFDDNSDTDKSLEMATAKLMLNESRKLPKDSKFKSYDLVASAWNDLSIKIGELTEKTRDWLIQNHQINWSQPNADITANDLKLEILTQNSTPPSLETSEYLIPYRLTNRSHKTIHRLSIFSIPLYGELESSEVLLGTIGPEESKSGVINLNAQHISKPDRAILIFGAAIDAEPIQDVHLRIAIDLPVIEPLTLSAFASLDDSASNGKKDACIEPGETAKVRIEIRNVGHVKGSDLKVSVQNLNGNQLEIDAVNLKIDELEPGKSTAITIAVKGHEKIYTAKLELGLSIEARQLQRRFQQVIPITALANAQGKDVLDYSSH